MKYLYFVVVCALSSVAFSQAPEPVLPVIQDVYLARDDGNGKAGEPVTEFRTTDIPIHCVVLLDASAKVTVKMNFVAVNVAGVRAETKVVTASYTTTEKQNRVFFTGHPDGTWTPGKYRVDLFINGKPAGKVEFEIKRPSGNVLAAKFSTAAPAPPRPKPPKRVRKP